MMFTMKSTVYILIVFPFCFYQSGAKIRKWFYHQDENR